MLRLQAKQEQRGVLAAVTKGDSQVSHVARDLPEFLPTVVTSGFVNERKDSWQAHLQRISPFLVAGAGAWWTYTPDGFCFHDGDNSPASPHTKNFTLLHHRWHSVTDVEHRREACWKTIVDKRMVIPACSIKLYDLNGNRSGRLLYINNTVTVDGTSPTTSGGVDMVTREEPRDEVTVTGGASNANLLEFLPNLEVCSNPGAVVQTDPGVLPDSGNTGVIPDPGVLVVASGVPPDPGVFPPGVSPDPGVLPDPGVITDPGVFPDPGILPDPGVLPPGVPPDPGVLPPSLAYSVIMKFLVVRVLAPSSTLIWRSALRV